MLPQSQLRRYAFPEGSNFLIVHVHFPAHVFMFLYFFYIFVHECVYTSIYIYI